MLKPIPRARERTSTIPPNTIRKLEVTIVLPRPMYSKTIPNIITIKRILTPFAIKSPY